MSDNLNSASFRSFHSHESDNHSVDSVNNVMAGKSEVEAGFAKLQGEDFEYFMQTYSIILGRNSKKCTVDLDLFSLGGGMNISRHHARIFYDFPRRRFAREVLGRNGCFVENVLHLPGTPPVKLDSQDHLKIGDKEFYFLLPARSILGGGIGPRSHVRNPGVGSGVERAPHQFEGDVPRNDALVVSSSGAKKGRRDALSKKKGEGKSRVNRDVDIRQLLLAQEKDVASSVATCLFDLCGPREWISMEKLHSKLVEMYVNVWHHSWVRRYLTPEEHPSAESQGKPWYGLLMLLRKYPEHFVITKRSTTGHLRIEFVSLVSPIS